MLRALHIASEQESWNLTLGLTGSLILRSSHYSLIYRLKFVHHGRKEVSYHAVWQVFLEHPFFLSKSDSVLYLGCSQYRCNRKSNAKVKWIFKIKIEM